MDHRRLALVSAFLAAFSVPVFAGYAVPADPPGFTRGGAWGPGFGYATNAANDQTFGRIVHQPGGVKVPIPGGHTTMPASYRFAQNAPKFAARIIFAHPGLRTAAGIASWLGLAKIFWDDVEKLWKQIPEGTAEPSDGYEYYMSGTGYHTSPIGACTEYVSLGQGKENPRVEPFGSGWTCRYRTFWIDSQGKKNVINENAGTAISIRPSACPSGWYQTPAGCVQQPPPITLTPEQFEDTLPGQPMPETVPKELPYPSPLPVDPVPWINPEPGPNPETRPRFIPSGDPVPNPKYDPNAEPSPQNQPYIQPGVRIQPSPTPQEPFRVDIQPVDKPLPTPTPEPEQDEGPGQNPNTKPQENPGLCDMYPDILACGKMDDVSPEEVNDEQKTISITPEAGWGAENSACPAPKTATVHGINLEMSWQPFCDFATGIRPVVIAMAWVSAFLLVLGVSRRES